MLPSSAPDHEPAWQSINEVAATFGVHRDTIRRMIARGEIEAVRFGPSLIRINVHSIPDAARSMGGAA